MRAHTPRKSALDRLHELGGKPRIRTISTPQSDPSRVAITFDGVHDGARATRISIRARDLKRLSLVPGMVLDAETLEALKRAVRLDMAHRAALASLQRAPCSRRRLIERLSRRGAQDRAILETVCDELSAAGILNDEASARSAARAMVARRPAGKRLIEQKLRAKGIAPATAKAAAEEAVADRDPLTDATALARKRLRTMSPDLERHVVVRRLSGVLARGGFDPDVCRRAIERAVGESIDDA